MFCVYILISQCFCRVVAIEIIEISMLLRMYVTYMYMYLNKPLTL